MAAAFFGERKNYSETRLATFFLYCSISTPLLAFRGKSNAAFLFLSSLFLFYLFFDFLFAATRACYLLACSKPRQCHSNKKGLGFSRTYPSQSTILQQPWKEERKTEEAKLARQSVGRSDGLSSVMMERALITFKKIPGFRTQLQLTTPARETEVGFLTI